MIAGVQSAVSGLRAYAVKVENNANNIANLQTQGYKKDRVLLSSQVPQGVATVVEQVDTPGPVVVEQTDRGQEMIELANVDLGEELPDLMRNTDGFEANLKMLQVADTMERTLIDLKA
ncbi:flagellar basal body rod C-terminal domain-containing protein [Desulfobulbus elongatus]|uniref:flagellar basal body rod C-terminal domain-containing protein n=1 Tax=Desulfobulbus elongatus TaxID=53332 RepID=UPI0004834B2E|nr:flagellar basal body rod C-terminal domain-containing protein [Desulfobulbus elongatus]